jgi:hypothetical protein
LPVKDIDNITVPLIAVVLGFLLFDEALIMVEIDGDHLTIEQVAAVARGGETVELSAAGKEKINGRIKFLKILLI